LPREERRRAIPHPDPASRAAPIGQPELHSGDPPALPERAARPEFRGARPPTSQTTATAETTAAEDHPSLGRQPADPVPVTGAVQKFPGEYGAGPPAHLRCVEPERTKRESIP